MNSESGQEVVGVSVKYSYRLESRSTACYCHFPVLWSRVIRMWSWLCRPCMQRSQGSRNHCRTLLGRWNMNHSHGIV